MLCGLREFPDVLEILPGSMIVWKIRQNARIPAGIPAHDGRFFPVNECETYLRETRFCHGVAARQGRRMTKAFLTDSEEPLSKR